MPDFLETTDGPSARTLALLAKELGASLISVKVWCRDPEAPPTDKDGRYPVNAWKEFMRLKSKRPVQSKAVSSQKHDLQVALLEEQVKQKRFQNEVEEGLYLSQDEVIQAFTDMAAEFTEALKREKHELAQNLSGLDVPEITKRLGDSARRILTNLSLNESFKKKVGFARLYVQQSDLLKRAIRGSGLSEM